MKILVLAQSYPSETSKDHMFIHVRNLYYKQNGAEVDVLSFYAQQSYRYEGVSVITESEYNKAKKNYDILISHASNVRNNYRFLRKNDVNFKKLIFIFHGHEILRLSKEYPKEYKYKRKDNFIRNIIQDLYDTFKFWVFGRYYRRVKDKSYYVFVSNWLRQRFYKNLKIKIEELKGKDYVINNCVGEVFEKEYYNSEGEKKYDFITIRGNIDGSKYCVDLVNELAKKNKDYSFLLIGKGKYFDYNEKAKNLVWINRQMNHTEMIGLINESRYALMPTREDTQGVMTCELATFGISTITSDIEVCQEIFAKYPNVILVPNNADAIDLKKIMNSFAPKSKTHKYYVKSMTLKKEWDLIERSVRDNEISR